MMKNKKITVAILVIISVIVAGFFVFSFGHLNCEDLYNEIENDLEKANYCEQDSDCEVLVLGGMYVKFGCYHFINKEVDKEQFYKKMGEYHKRCSSMINKCAPSPEPICVSGKCVYNKK